MQDLVEPAPGATSLQALDGARDRVSAEQHVVDAGKVTTFGGGLVGQGDHRSSGDVETGFDHAIVSERDPDSRIGTEQTSLPDLDDVGPTSGQGAHDRSTATDVRALSDNDTRTDSTLDHGRTKGSGVEIDETLVHHGRSHSNMGTKTNPVGICDPDPTWHDVVGHPGELVNRRHRRCPIRSSQSGPGIGEPINCARTFCGPHHIVEDPKYSLDADVIGSVDAMREKM